MTINEQSEIFDACRRGEEVEFCRKDTLCDNWFIVKSDHQFDFVHNRYRIKKKRWRADKAAGTYYFINACMEICEEIDTYCPDDDDHYKVGNYFRAREDAERAIELIKETLTKFHEENK